MPDKLSKEEQMTWDRLKYGVPPNSMDRSAWRYSCHKPSPAQAGSIYFDTAILTMMIFDGNSWKAIT